MSIRSKVQLADGEVGGIGYGLMGLTWKASPPPYEQSFKAMKAALECGATFWNGGELYGPPDANSLQLLNAYFTKYPEDADKVVISIKGGLKPGQMMPDGSEENTCRSIDECIKQLGGKKKLDIWEAARVDPKTPIEVQIRTAAQYIKEGKLGAISLSEVSADSIRRAAAVTKISAVEVELSLWSTEILSNGVAQACADLDIPIVAYSPLGRGFLTGQIQKPEDIPDDDMRKHVPRFQGEAFWKNIKLVEQVQKLAEKKGCTAGQASTAWVRYLAGKPGLPKVIIPIPGASHEDRVKENSVEVDLTKDEFDEIQKIVESVEIEGSRYQKEAMSLCFGDTPPLQK